MGWRYAFSGDPERYTCGGAPMKLIHVKQARCVWIFDLQDLNPKGKDVLEDLVDWIKETYSFAVAPDLDKVMPPPSKETTGNLSSSGLIFQRGRFQAREDSFIEIVSLTLFNDGIVIDTTSSTQEGDQFAADLLSRAAKEFVLAYEPEMIRKRLYVSTLIVRSEISLSTVHPALAAFGERISKALANGVAPQFQFQLAGLAFWTEPNDSGVHKTFSFMPQAGKSLAEHRYYSEAPLKTEDHLRLLEDFERLLAKP
jgi:hypothetical protein